MVLVGDEDYGDVLQPGGNDTPIHGIAHHAVNPEFSDEPPDADGGPDHVGHDPFGAPERLFETEKTVFPFQADFAGSVMEVRAVVQFHEIVGFPVPGKVNRVSLLLHVMPEMETAGCMPESFATDNKENLHETFRIFSDGYRFPISRSGVNVS
jgi:hypothetical protein